MLDEIIKKSQRITQKNYNNRTFRNDSFYNNENKLLCSICEKQSTNNYIHKYSKSIRCKNCTNQIEQPI